MPDKIPSSSDVVAVARSTTLISAPRSFKLSVSGFETEEGLIAATTCWSQIDRQWDRDFGVGKLYTHKRRISEKGISYGASRASSSTDQKYCKSDHDCVMQERVIEVEDIATTWKNSVDYHDDAITWGVIPIVIVRWSYAGSL